MEEKTLTEAFFPSISKDLQPKYGF